MTDEEALSRLSDEWQTTWETGINPRVLQRFLGNGWVQLERRSGKRYWRLKHAPDQEGTSQ